MLDESVESAGINGHKYVGTTCIMYPIRWTRQEKDPHQDGHQV